MRHHYAYRFRRPPSTGDTSARRSSPALTLRSGDRATIETSTHHANDDYERMIADDPGAESVFHWTPRAKGGASGAAPVRPRARSSRGSGEGVGVHLLTGSDRGRGRRARRCARKSVSSDIRPRPSCHACHAGRCFGSNVAANWGFHYHDLIEEPKPREVVTIFELDTSGEPFAKRRLQLRLDSADRSGRHRAFDDRLSGRAGRSHHHSQAARISSANVKVPARLHFGTMGLAPSEAGFRQLESRRATPAATSTTGGSARARGCIIRSRCPARFSRWETRTRPRGTANSAAPPSRPRLTGDFEFILHKRPRPRRHSAGGAYPSDAGDRQRLVVCTASPIANYLAELGADAQTEIAM